mmetsp:Transcript_19569/g.35277  ORF Transcript_19569/g.35277 Transcript_19569/m.35277 type:complete len:314 (-) Transcript_19569:380-1321(-)
MGDTSVINQATHFLDLDNDILVRLLHMNTLEIRYLFSETTVEINGARNALTLLKNVVGEAYAVIILTKCGGLVNNTCTAVVGDVTIRNDAEGSGDVLEIREERLILEPDQFGSRLAEQNFKALFGLSIFVGLTTFATLCGLRYGAGDEGEARFSDNVDTVFFVVTNPDVSHSRVNAEGNIAGKGPRGSCPCHKGSVIFVTDDRKRNHDGRIADVLIILPSLEVGKRSGTGGGKGHNFETLVDKTLFEKLLEHPPDTFHEAGVQGLVIILEINPASQTLNSFLPFFRVPHNNAPTFLIVIGDSKFKYVLATLNT